MTPSDGNIADPSETSMREARARYFAENALPADGGYTAATVPLQLGPIRIAFPNSPARIRAVRFHDLHHVVTGYGTTWTGEAEIAAWEIASGCGRHHAAWVLNLFALAVGIFLEPRAMLAAFARGRRSRNLYHEEWHEALLDERLGRLRQQLVPPEPETRIGAGDRMRFAAWAVAALLTLSLAQAATILTAPLSLPYLLKYRDET